MSAMKNGKTNAIDTDSDEEDAAQMRKLLEAADHTLLTNDMYTTKTTSSSTKAASEASPVQDLPKSQRYLPEQDAVHASDLQISNEMQAHLWNKLSTIIQNQIEFCTIEKEANSDSLQGDTTWFSKVKLVANADCYVSDYIEPTIGSQKKPKIKRRQLVGEEQPPITAADLASVAVDSDSIISGRDTQCWAPKNMRKNKLFEYRASDSLGLKLQAIEPINEFTKQRRKNKWNESKISQRFRKMKS